MNTLYKALICLLLPLSLFSFESEEWVQDVSDHLEFILRDLCSEDARRLDIEAVVCSPEFIKNQWVKKESEKIPQSSWVLGIGEESETFRETLSHTCYFAQYQGDPSQNTRGGQFFSDPAHIPVPDGVFDVIFCFEPLGNHFKPIKILKECQRVLKPGGNLYLFSQGPLENRLDYYADFGPKWYEEVFKKTDLSLVNTYYFGKPLQSIAREVSHIMNYWETIQKTKPAEYQELLKMLFGEVLPRVIYDIHPPEEGKETSLGYVVKAVKRDRLLELLHIDTE